ncbi:uncharacterized protein LOC124593904 [Schistocerca americana]|uniref:uncharacterized protein LOC124593904 n=1 Tax=Schistocerca americana TaxID=7009 RepID=UPI001F4F23D3|nr:uncharacterized protein LOC124593904 [Schistocerca americana]
MAVKFSGKTFFRIPNKILKRRKGEQMNRYEIVFRTTELNGLLLWLGKGRNNKGHHFGVTVADGFPEMRFNLGKKQATLQISKSKVYVSDGAWHTLMAYRRQRHGFLQVDDESPIRALSLSGPVRLHSNGGIVRKASAAPEQEGSAGGQQSSERSELQVWLMRQAPPLDYSYARLRELDHLEDMGLEPRTDRVRRAPQRSKKSGLYITRSLWLSNNLLKSVRGLQALTRRLLWQPEALAWLNLSHNFLVELGAELADFHNLTILYLHCNRVHTLSGIAVLRHLPFIAHLTLHGNPLAQVPFYRRAAVVST